MCTHYIFSLSTYPLPYYSFFFFFNDTATTEIYTLSLHDALPISFPHETPASPATARTTTKKIPRPPAATPPPSCNPRCSRSEEHTSELQSRLHLVCRLLLEKKKKTHTKNSSAIRYSVSAQHDDIT